MKKRTAFIGAILSLIPFGQPLIIKTGFFVSNVGFILSIPDEAKAKEISPEDEELAFDYYIDGSIKFFDEDYKGAIADFNKALELTPNDLDTIAARGIAKEAMGDLKGACDDFKKASQSGDKDYIKWAKEVC